MNEEDNDEPGCWVGPQLSQLTSLTLGPCSNGDAVLAALPAAAAAASLKHCMLMDANVEQESVPFLAKLTSLQHLDLNKNMMVEEVSPLTALSHLTFLGLDGTLVADLSVPAISEMQQLVGLRLDYSNIGCFGCLSALSQLHKLEELVLKVYVWDVSYAEEMGEEGEQMPEELGLPCQIPTYTSPCKGFTALSYYVRVHGGREGS